MSDTDLKEKEEAVLGSLADDFSPAEKAEYDELAENDPEGGLYKPGKTKASGKLSRPKKIAAGIVSLGVAGSVMAMFIFAPILKLESFIANINQRAFGYASGAVEARVGHLMERYMISHLLALESCGNNVTINCRANTGSGLAAGLFSNWRDIKIEEKLFDKYGLEIETNKNPDPSTGRHRVEIRDRRGRQINLSDGDLSNGRFTGGNREFGRDMRKFMREETKWYQVMERRSVRKYLARKHNINSWCFMACQGRDNVDSRISSAQTRLKYKFVERFVYPFSGKYGLLLDCIIDGKTGGACSRDSFRERHPDRAPLPDAEVDDITGRFGDGNSTRLTQYIVEKMVSRIFTQGAGRAAASAIPIAGQVYLAVSIASMANNMDSFIQNNGLSKFAAEINSAQYLEYYTGMRSSADEIKSSALNLDEVGALVSEFDGAEQSLVYQSENKSTLVAGSLFGGRAYAATDEYNCLNGQPIPAGELVCNEKKVARTYAVEDIRDNAIVSSAASVLNTYGSCGPLEVAGRCPPGTSMAFYLDPVLNAINSAAGFVAGPIVDTAMSVARAIPYVGSFIDFLQGVVADFIGWIFGKVFPLPVRVDSPGREKYDGMVAGSEVVAGNFCQGGYVNNQSFGLGCVPLSPVQAAEIKADQEQQIAYNKEDYNLYQRLTDLEDPNSLATAFVYNTPTSPSEGFASIVSGFSNIFSFFGFLGNMFVPSYAGAAIEPGESAFGITRNGYPLNDPSITQNPDLLTPAYCAQAKVAWEASKRENPVTGFDEYTVPNPCLLEEAAIEAAGALFTNN